MFLLQQNPIVVEMVRQPPVTPEISYGSVLASAALMAVSVFAAAMLVGAVIGGVIIWRKRQQEKTSDVAAPSHVRLQI